MGIKDWKQTGNTFTRIKKKQGKIYKISLWKTAGRNYWQTTKYFYNPNKSFQPTSTESHNLKKQALAYAKAFMRKH